jgi:glycolate oxidase iron-sulfur subunit
MRTAFRQDQLTDPHLAEAEQSLRACVHCGFCTATCPTYLVLGDERDSPRGRILLMQQMLQENAVPTAQTVTHLDRCLSCLGCRTTCPSGVDYAALIDTARAHIETHYKRPLAERLIRFFVPFVMMRPVLFRTALNAARLFAPIARNLPGRLGVMARKVPKRAALSRAERETIAAPQGARNVALLSGCVQPALAPAIDAAAARVLARSGAAVKTLEGAQCCGSLAYHLGQVETAKSFARRVIEAFEAADSKEKIDALLITVTGCAAFLKDYGRVFADEPEWKHRAEAVAARAKDFSELASPLKTALPRPLSVSYHPPCSLQHAQRLAGSGEKLLATAGFALKPFADTHLCCGSAGSYSILQPELASELRARKLATIEAGGADILISANIGCLAHLSDDALPTLHIAQALDWAQGGPEPAELAQIKTDRA